MKRNYTYKLTVNEAYWHSHLKKIGKVLTRKDKILLRSTKNENQDNISMNRIQQRALKNGLHIPCLTNLVGDCMFESIEKTGFCKDRKIFRQSVALMMFLFGNCNIIKTYNSPLKNTFAMFNDVEYVFCHKTKRLYKYTYYTMCSDMFSDGSWSRLPTEIVLTVIAYLFKVRINIYHDNGHINKICDPDLDKILSSTDPKSNINIALIGEHHYVPLTRVPPHVDSGSLKCPKYCVQLKKFLKWAENKADMIGLFEDEYEDEYEDEDSDDSHDSNDNNNCNNGNRDNLPRQLSQKSSDTASQYTSDRSDTASQYTSDRSDTASQYTSDRSDSETNSGTNSDTDLGATSGTNSCTNPTKLIDKPSKNLSGKLSDIPQNKTINSNSNSNFDLVFFA